MNEQEQRRIIVKYWWSKSEDSLQSAKREFEAKSYIFSINRIYYAAFYGVSAALFEKKKSFKKHSGVRSAFHKHFIKTNLLDIKFGKLYDQLFEDRQEGDYIALQTFEPEYIQKQFNKCSDLLINLKPLICTLNKDKKSKS